MMRRNLNGLGDTWMIISPLSQFESGLGSVQTMYMTVSIPTPMVKVIETGLFISAHTNIKVPITRARNDRFRIASDMQVFSFGCRRVPTVSVKISARR